MCVFVISGDEPRCKNVKCPKVNPRDCKGIIPPGACCPHCGKNLYIEICDTHLFRKTWKDKIYFRLKPAIILDFFLNRRVSYWRCRNFGAGLCIWYFFGCIYLGRRWRTLIAKDKCPFLVHVLSFEKLKWLSIEFILSLTFLIPLTDWLWVVSMRK